MWNDKTKEFLGKTFGYLIVFIVCAVYVCTAFVTLDETGKTVPQILLDGALSFILGFMINRMLDLQGITNAERDLRFRSTQDLHSETVSRIAPYIDKLDEWCEEKNRENLKTQRSRCLANEGMRYGEFFNDDGSVKEVKIDPAKFNDKYLGPIERRKVKCFHKALRLRLTPLTAGELTSEHGKADDPFNFGRTKTQFEKQSSTEDLIFKLGTALIFGYYSVRMLQDFSYATLVWNGLQVAFFLISGVIKMFASEQFILGEYRGRIVKKISYLEMFESYSKNKEESK